MQAQFNPKPKAKTKPKTVPVPGDAGVSSADPPARDRPHVQQGDTIVDQNRANTDDGTGILRAELFELREQSLDAFQALVCSIVRREKAKENQSSMAHSQTLSQLSSPTMLHHFSHTTTEATSTSSNLNLTGDASTSVQSRDGSNAIALAGALLLEAPSPPSHDPSNTPASMRNNNKACRNHPSASLAASPSPSHSAATSLLQVLSQRAGRSARRRHSVASLSPISISSHTPSSTVPSSVNSPETPISPRTSSGMMKSLRSRFRSSSISSSQVEPSGLPTQDHAPAKEMATEPPQNRSVLNPVQPMALSASTASMDLAFALASLLEDVTTLLASDSKPSTTDLTRVQAAMDQLVFLVDVKKAAPTSTTSATDTMCDSHSASHCPDCLLESATGETSSVHTVGPDVDYGRGADASMAKESTKEIRYSAEPPPYDAHDFGKQKHAFSTRLRPIKEKMPSEKRSPSEPASPSELELEKLVITIERLNRRGRLDNQAVHLSTRQRDQLEDAAISARIDRLARGRFEDQRAVSSANEQTRLMAAITDSNKTRSLANQRVEMSSQMQRRMDLARLGHLADRLANSGRMEDQDAVPKRFRELDHLARELERLSRPSGMDSQRYTMNEAKEKDMFLSQMAHRVSRLTDCRMEDQAADGPGVRKAAAFREVDQALDRMAALSSSHLMDGQRYHV